MIDDPERRVPRGLGPEHEVPLRDRHAEAMFRYYHEPPTLAEHAEMPRGVGPEHDVVITVPASEPWSTAAEHGTEFRLTPAEYAALIAKYPDAFTREVVDRLPIPPLTELDRQDEPHEVAFAMADEPPTLAEYAEMAQLDPMAGVPLRGWLRLAWAVTKAGFRDAWARLRGRGP